MMSGDDSVPLVYFDLETANLDFRHENISITQIAAESEDKTFDVYVKPTCPISQWSIENTYITYNFQDQQLFYIGEKVPSQTPQEALRSFMAYLGEFGEPVILVAHYGHHFDSLVLYHHLKRYNLWNEFMDLVLGFADTIPMFQMVQPNLSCYKLNYLATKFLPRESYSSHNAVDDTNILKMLVEKEGNTYFLVKECFQSCSRLEESQKLC